ncbi:hypothetical protein BC628DRAFT_1408347 [Trametes gibbosa]|nr:hypothetical protein BC628DRAFT_1408347 [Trametes gibbosa]
MSHTNPKQVDLVVQNYFGCKAPLFEWTKQADELIKWLWSRTYLLEGMPGFRGTAKTIIRGVATRWTSHYLAYCRLLELQGALHILANDPRIYLSGNEESHAKTRSMVPIIQNGLFWHSLTRIKQHLEPLAITANMTQSNACRLDQVLITFRRLFQSFSELDSPDEDMIKTAVLRSLQMHWDKADQDVFLAAAILNPFLKCCPFRALPLVFAPAAVHTLLERLWNRFYPSHEAPATFYNEVSQYLRETGDYINLSSTKQAIEKAAAAEHFTSLPHMSYPSARHPQTASDCLAHLGLFSPNFATGWVTTH